MEHLGTFCQIVFGVLVVYLVPNMFINRQDFDLMYQMIAVEAGLAILVKQTLAQLATETAVVVEGPLPLWMRAQREV
jgi:hypothetical protein